MALCIVKIRQSRQQVHSIPDLDFDAEPNPHLQKVVAEVVAELCLENPVVSCVF